MMKTFPNLLSGRRRGLSLPAPGTRAAEEDTHCWGLSLCEQHMFLLPGIFPVVLLSHLLWRQIYMQANESWHFLCCLLHLLLWFNAIQVSTNRKASFLSPSLKQRNNQNGRSCLLCEPRWLLGYPATEFHVIFGVSTQLQRKEIYSWRGRVWI